MLTMITHRKEKSKFLARHRPPPVRPPYITKVYRCSITPTRLLLFPPEDDANNTVLRDYRAHSDRFLRVSFTDEDDNFYVSPHRPVNLDLVIDSTHRLPGRPHEPHKRCNTAFGRHSGKNEKGHQPRTDSCRQKIRLSGCWYIPDEVSTSLSRHEYEALKSSRDLRRSHSCWFIHEDTTFDPPFTTKHIRDSIGIIDERCVDVDALPYSLHHNEYVPSSSVVAKYAGTVNSFTNSIIC